MESNNSQASEPTIGDFDWDESARTVTAFTWAKAQSKLPISGRRVYGRRTTSSISSGMIANVHLTADQNLEDSVLASAVSSADSGQTLVTSTLNPLLEENSIPADRPMRRPSKKRNMLIGSELRGYTWDADYQQLLPTKDYTCNCSLIENIEKSLDTQRITLPVKIPSHEAHRPPMVPRAVSSNKLDKTTADINNRSDPFLGDENIHPNSTLTRVDLKMNNPQPLSRGDRPISPLFFVEGSASTFSSLSKAGNVATTWTMQKTPCSTPVQRRRVFHRSSTNNIQGYHSSTPCMLIDKSIIDLETSSSHVHHGATSPTQSVSSSSRKRGSCRSPLSVDDDQDGMITLCTSEATTAENIPSSMCAYENDEYFNLSTTPFILQSSTIMLSSPDSAHKIILQKEAESIFHLEEGQIKSSLDFQDRRSMNFLDGDGDTSVEDNRSHDDSSTHDDEPDVIEDKAETDLRMVTSMDESDDEIKFKTSGRLDRNISCPALVSRPPTQVRRMSSTHSTSFSDCIFGPVDRADQDVKVDFMTHPMGLKFIENPLLVFDTMSSYEDLKFLVKELRRLKSGKTFTSFGPFKSWAIPLLHSWSPDRRYAFIAWTTKDLGFRIRKGGNSVLFLQIQPSGGLEVLKALEVALFEYKKLQSSERKLVRENLANDFDEICPTQFSSQIAYNIPLIPR